jgi:hypothetical protein
MIIDAPFLTLSDLVLEDRGVSIHKQYRVVYT